MVSGGNEGKGRGGDAYSRIVTYVGETGRLLGGNISCQDCIKNRNMKKELEQKHEG